MKHKTVTAAVGLMAKFFAKRGLESSALANVGDRPNVTLPSILEFEISPRPVCKSF